MEEEEEEENEEEKEDEKDKEGRRRRRRRRERRRFEKENQELGGGGRWQLCDDGLACAICNMQSLRSRFCLWFNIRILRFVFWVGQACALTRSARRVVTML